MGEGSGLDACEVGLGSLTGEGLTGGEAKAGEGPALHYQCF